MYKVLDKTAADIDPLLKPQIMLMSELRESCYDAKYEILGLISMGAPIYDPKDMLGAIKIVYPHLKEPNKSSHVFIDGLLHGGVILGCIGPQLGSLLTFIIAQRNLVNGVLMIIFYGIGFITPFFIFGLILTDKVFQFKLMRYITLVQRIGGILMLAAAVYLIYFSLQGFI